MASRSRGYGITKTDMVRMRARRACKQPYKPLHAR
jgi:hypothetical protein